MKQVDGEAGELETLSSGKVVAKENGYVYVFTSNESNNDVFFDNFGVMDITGPVLEETHYYPFGLTMTGISTTAPLKLEAKRKFNGKESNHKEFSDGNGLDWYDYGARMYDAQIDRFFNIDPLAEKYPGISPYNYTLDNPINLTDPTGMAPNPIYDREGILLGTDDRGLKGKALVMDKKDFKQNMSHQEALNKDLGVASLKGKVAKANLLSSFNSLPSRPDYDGVMTYTQLLEWGQTHGDEPVFLDASKIDLGDLYVSDFNGAGQGKFVNTPLIHNTPLNTYATWGKNYMVLMSASGKVKLSNDRFDYGQHSLGKAWQEGYGTWAYEFFIRHPSISILQTIHGVNGKFGFDLRPYGYGQLKKEPSFIMKVANFIGAGLSGIKN